MQTGDAIIHLLNIELSDNLSDKDKEALDMAMDALTPKELKPMTEKELKTEAKKMGYRLVKNPKYEKFLPCICGSNRRHIIPVAESVYDPRRDVIVKCAKCGLSVNVEKRSDIHTKWNSFIKEKTDDEAKIY